MCTSIASIRNILMDVAKDCVIIAPIQYGGGGTPWIQSRAGVWCDTKQDTTLHEIETKIDAQSKSRALPPREKPVSFEWVHDNDGNRTQVVKNATSERLAAIEKIRCAYEEMEGLEVSPFDMGTVDVDEARLLDRTIEFAKNPQFNHLFRKEEQNG